MNDIFLVIFVGFFNILSFWLGAKISQNYPKDETELKLKELFKNNNESINNKDNGKEQIINSINLENIDNYDGTGLGQKDFPRAE